MDYTYCFISEEISESLLRTFLDFIIMALKKYNIKEVNISFRYAWGDFINNWNYFTIRTTAIKQEIENAEAEEFGRLGSDDLFILAEQYETEIQFCHHGDLHLFFNHENDLAKDIIDYWNEHQITFNR